MAELEELDQRGLRDLKAHALKRRLQVKKQAGIHFSISLEPPRPAQGGHAVMV